MSQDKREHLRLPVASTIFIELVASGIGEHDDGHVAACKTLDVSRGGLQVSLEQPLRVGAILQIGVELPSLNETLYLAGEVRWCRPDASGNDYWSAGFELQNAADSDIERWVDLLTDMDS